MASRILQQKLLKIKKFRMKRKGQFRTGKGPTLNGTSSKYSANMALMSQFHGNPKIHPDQAWLDVIFPSANMTPHRRLEVIHRINQMREMLPEERSVYYVPGKISSLRLFVKTPEGEPAYYFFVEFHHKLGVVRKSISYRTRTAATTVHVQNKIRWKEVLHISEPDPLQARVAATK